MTEQPSLKFSAQFVLALAGILVLPALWSLSSAFWSAVTTGQVMVISVGRYETSRSMVPWLQGWARFIGPIFLVAALLTWTVATNTVHRTAVWWLSVAQSLIGLVLLMFSQWFTSIGGALWFCCMASMIGITLYVGNRFGRLAAVLVMVMVWALIVWRVVATPGSPVDRIPPGATPFIR